MLISRAWPVLTGTEIWQGIQQLVPLLEKEVPPKSPLLVFLPCPSLASHPGAHFSPGSASLLRDGSRYAWKVLPQQLSTLGCSQVLLLPPRDRENTSGKPPLAITRAGHAPVVAGQGTALGLPNPVTSPPSLEEAQPFQQESFPAAGTGTVPHLPCSQERRAHTQLCLGAGCRRTSRCRWKHTAASSALHQGLCGARSPGVSTPRSSQILRSCRAEASPCQTALRSSAAGIFHSSFCPFVFSSCAGAGRTQAAISALFWG